VAIDAETLVDPVYFSAFAARLADRGFCTLLYGSAHFVTQNPGVNGHWAALLTANRPTMLPFGVVGQQWRFGAEFDFSVFDEFVYANCGHGPRIA
jgi:hypothetical protein